MHRPSLRRPALTWLLSAAMLAGPIGPAYGGSAPPPRDDDGETLQRAYARGEERFHAGDLDGAIEAFAGGLSRVGDDGSPRLRAYFSVSLAIAHLDRYDADGRTVDLERAYELLVQTIDRDAEVLRGEPRLEALARRNLERARLHRPPATESENAEPSAPAEAAQPSPPAESRVTNPPTPDSPVDPSPSLGPAPAAERHRALGIGLLVSGTALVVGGLAVVIDGATLERRARAIAEDPPQGRQKTYIEDEVPRLARIRYAVAGPALAVGVGLIVGGGILLHRAAGRPRVVVAPWITPRGASVALRASF